MIRWLRVVWPPWWALVLAGVVYMGFEACLLLVEGLAGLPFFSTPDVRQVFQGIVGQSACIYAIFRVWAFHPALRPGYCQWLRSTPWSIAKPLPLGPIHVVWQDVLLLGLLFALGWPRLQWGALVVVPAFLFPYLVLLGILHFFTGARWMAYGVGFGIGFMILSVLDPLYFAISAAVSYACAWLGLRASLAHFPWGRTSEALQRVFLSKALGWPYDHLGPQSPDLRTLPIHDTLQTGALGGWWFFALSYHNQGAFDADAMNYLVFLFFFLGGAAARVLIYVYGYPPPLSILGRLAHGRLIIPAYDQVFVAPLLALLVGSAVPVVPGLADVPSLVVTPIGFAVTWWILFGMGPSLQLWRLTGNHRVVPGLMNRAQFTQ
jgi:hypothetical protein